MNNFVSVFEELSKLYEAEELEQEIAAEESEVDEEVPAEEVPAEEVAAEETPKQLVLECSKCGAIIMKAEEEVVIDEATDLANVEDECAACEEAAGYKVLGELLPYAAAEEAVEKSAEEPADQEETEADEELDAEMTETLVETALTEGKVADTLKKVATRVGADAATILRCFAELGDSIVNKDTKFYDFAEYVENKAVLKALMSGNETVLNTCTKEDIEELAQDVAEYEKAKNGEKEKAE